MFVMFDCCILQYIKNICCRFNLEIMTFIFDFYNFNPPQHLFLIAFATGRLFRNSEYSFSNYPAIFASLAFELQAKV